MNKMDEHLARKCRRLVSGEGSNVVSSGASSAVEQFPSNVGGSVVIHVATPANPITLFDSSDDSNGGATISNANNNNEIVSFYLLLFS